MVLRRLDCVLGQTKKKVLAQCEKPVAKGTHENAMERLLSFSVHLERVLDELFIDRMENNEAIFSRVMTDKEFRNAAVSTWRRRPLSACGK